MLHTFFMERNTDEKLKIYDLAESERPRERMLMYGASALSNAELMAVLISSGNARDSALDLASRVLSLEGGSLANLSRCLPEEFCRVPGIGTATACRLAAAMELGKRVSGAAAEKIKLNEPSCAAALCEDMRFLQKEMFRILMVNAKIELIARENISVGSINSSNASPREVFAGAVRRGAYALILVHNHPSGDPSPSSCDRDVTEQLCRAGDLLGIRVLDHIIIGDGRYFSFKEENLL